MIKHPSVILGGLSLVASIAYAVTQQLAGGTDDVEARSLTSTNYSMDPNRYDRGRVSDKRISPVHRVTSFLEQSQFSDAASQIKGFSIDELLTLTTYLETQQEFDSEALSAMLLEVCGQVAEDNPRNAVFLAGSFFYLPGLVAFENEVFKSWSETGLSEILAYLDEPITPVRRHHISMLATLVQKERLEMLPEMLEWASQYSSTHEMDPEEANFTQDTFAEIASNLTRFSSEESLPDIARFLAKNAHNPSAAANLAGVLEESLVHDEAMAGGWLQWLEDSGPKNHGISVMLTTAAIGGLTNHDPDHAVRLLSSPGFIDRFTTPKAKGETDEQFESRKEVFFDELLERFLQNTIAGDPEGALANAQEFHDPKKRASMEEWARQLITNSPSKSDQTTK